MPKSYPALVNPEILKWARETSGYNIERISKSMSIDIEKLKKIEEGEESLTVSQLRKIARLYKRSTPVFYLEKVPENIDLPDFRTSSLTIDIKKAVQSLNITLRVINEKRDNAIYISKRLGLELDYNIIEEASKIRDIDTLSFKIRDYLGISRNDLLGKRDNAVLNYWKEKIEHKNILVFQFQNIPPEEIRGFVIADVPFPTIALNQKETYYARVFTLIHEFCHILMKKSGKCDVNLLSPLNDDVEQKCNALTSQVLVPSEELLFEWDKLDRRKIDMIKRMEDLSRNFKVSWSVILYRLRVLKKIEDENFEGVLTEIEKRRKRQKTRRRGKVNYHTVFISKNSKLYLNLIYQSLDQNLINYSQALKFTGQRFDTFKKTMDIFMDRI